MTQSAERLKDEISRYYAAQLVQPTACCDDGVYPVEVLGRMPEGVVSFGCGNPVALASMRPGERVLDLGSGAGLDCFLAVRQVGPEGWVVGVDFTPDMIERATANARRLHLANVSFRRGDIEALPLEDSSFDVVMSNCVVNLAPDKDAVFREAFRVLAPGGRVMVSDILLTRSATEAEMADFALLSGCVSGSLPTDEYLGKLTAAGFTDVRVDTEHEPEAGTFWYSGAVSATKPA